MSEPAQPVSAQSVPTQPATDAQSPKSAGLVLATLILVAAVANLAVSSANVALPDISRALDASQTGLDLIATGYALGIAASVLWFGALGDRYGRKRLLMIGVFVTIPAALLAALAPNVTILFIARVIGGIGAGMAFPTTLSLITALWAGAARLKAIALWSGIGSALSATGPVLAGLLLERFHWGSVFLLTVPLAIVALLLAAKTIPAHVNESTERVDNLSGLMSAVLVGVLIVGLNFAPSPGRGALAAGLLVAAVAIGVAFVQRQRRLSSPLYDVNLLRRRRVFWVAALAGLIVYGSLMASTFIGQQFLQNVLGYSTLAAGAAGLPAVIMMVGVAPHSARLVERYGSRTTMMIGFGFYLMGFLWMLLAWGEGIGYWRAGFAYALIGIGSGIAGTPVSHSLTSSVPVRRAGMASATADLQRDLGGAVMQSILGAILTAGYAASVKSAIAASPYGGQVTDQVRAQLIKSFGSAAKTAERYPEFKSAIISGARESFLNGQRLAYVVGAITLSIGIVIVAVFFPGRDAESRMLADYAASDSDKSG